MRLEDTQTMYRKNGFELTEDLVISINDPELAYEFAKKYGLKNKKLEEIVLNSKDPKLNFYFARDIVNSDKIPHENIILESNNPYFSILYSVYVPDADIKKHQQIVLKSKNPYLNYYFALLITKRNLKLNMKSHEKVVLRSKDPEWNFQFVTVPGANIITHGDIIYKTGNERWIEAFNHCFKDRYEDAKIKRKKYGGSK